ncbi:Calmodulin [Diplonema papillatum]|nr:Calmodulin [Diplonema papillatum]|eukprot:gene19665-30303_t
MAMLLGELTAEQVQEYKNVFDMFDSDKSGAISITELSSALKSLGLMPSEWDLAKMMHEVDTDGTGQIEFDEFLALVSKRVTEPDLVDQLKRIFKKFDSDNDGFLNAQDLVYALETYAGTPMTVEEAKEMMHDVDPDGNGKIDLAEFIKLMCEPA